MKNKKLFAVLSVLAAATALLLIVLIYPTEEKITVPEEKEVSVRIRAVGDNLIHSPIYNSCREEDGFDFDGLYENIEPYLTAADIRAINQETIFVDSAEALSGYPAFGTPPEVGESIVKAGFNLVTHATNHTYDKGYDALLYTMNFWKRFENITVLGINKSEEEQTSVKYWEKDGLKMALLNFTYGLNGYTLPKDKKYLVNIFEKSDKTAALLQKAENEADITVVFMHFGTEYTHIPTAEQKEDAEFLITNGADLIIGAHPHVLQPAVLHRTKNQKSAPVFYSLGNFVSNQGGAEKVLGAMADVTVTKKNGRTYVEKYEMLPLVTHAEKDKYSVYMLSDYTDELAKKHKRCPNLTVESLRTLFEKIKNTEVY